MHQCIFQRFLSVTLYGLIDHVIASHLIPPESSNAIAALKAHGLQTLIQAALYAGQSRASCSDHSNTPGHTLSLKIRDIIYTYSGLTSLLLLTGAHRWRAYQRDTFLLLRFLCAPSLNL